MNILGINAFGQNPAACLLIDGKLVSFTHEERLNRLKGSHNLFPGYALNWCLNKNRLSIDDIDYIAFNWDCTKYPFKIATNLVKTKLNFFKKRINNKANGTSNVSFLRMINHLNSYSPKIIKQKIYDNLRMIGHKGKLPKIMFVNHHLSHAYQAYFQSDFDKALVLVADGHGEESCISGYKVVDDNFKKILHYEIPNSLGWFYSAITAYLGFTPNRDEGKLMGLAAYGEKNKNHNPWLERFDKLISIKKGELYIESNFLKFGGNSYHPRFTDIFVNFITSYDSSLLPIYLNEYVFWEGKKINKYLLPAYIDIAYAAQSKMEEVLTHLVNKMYEETGIKNLAFAGGVALNCKANRAILDNGKIDDIFIHPASSDDGSAIGSAFYVAKENGENIRNVLTNVQLGPDFSNDEILTSIKQYDLSYMNSDHITADAAKFLANGEIIGWFQDGSEMGPRALGGRSIVAALDNPAIKDIVNNRVKFRENWRPYCPSILSEHQSNYIKNAVDSPFMILAAEAKKELSKKAPAIVHIDNTIRPQSVKKERNNLWYDLINKQYELTGIPMVLNTSFNVRGEPIVCSPRDAIRTFFASGIDKLVIGDFVLSKR